MVYMGDNIEALSWYHWVLLLAVGLLFCLVLRRWVRLLPDGRDEGG